MISCIVNFKDNLTKNTSYYKLLLNQINNAQGFSSCHTGSVCEHTALASDKEDNSISKICEGYQFIIAFDGNLENSEKLKNNLIRLGYSFTLGNDAELALNAYIHFGEKAPSKLSGSFSFIIYDTMRRQIFAASDAFSSVPVFYTKSGDTYIFASQIRGILAHPDISPRISGRGLSSLLSFSKGLSAEIFENIHALPPGNILKIKCEEFVSKEYSPEYNSPSVYENPEDDFILLMSEKLKQILTESSAVLHLGGIKDEFLSAMSAKLQSEDMVRLTQYSAYEQGISKRYSALNTKVFYSKDSLVNSLKTCVDICGLPVLSGSDFLLPMIFEKTQKSVGNMLTTLPDTSPADESVRKILLDNNVFHPAVIQTIKDIPPIGKNVRINSANIIADVYGINLKSPFLSADIYNFLKNTKIPADDFLYTVTTRLFGTNMPVGKESHSIPDLKLKRILLDIISENSAPILAFFDKSALLRLCERGFDFSNKQISETEFVSYIIKLNFWFLKYRPVII